MSILDSILTSVKKKLGLDETYLIFDETIISHINTAFFVLWQLGIGNDPSKPFVIHDETAVWADFIDEGLIEAAKDDVYLRVKLLFDPPTNSFLVENIKTQISEYEWRMTVGVDEYKREANK